MYMHALQNRKYGRVTAVFTVLATMVLFPYLVHLFPPQAGVPMGARLLPLFWAPFLVIVLFDLKTALIAALFAPILNSFVVGQPTGSMITLLTIEAVVFCVVVSAAYRFWPNFILTAPLAYVAAVIVAAVVLVIRPLLPFPPLSFLTTALVNAIPGLLLLWLLNMTLVRYVKEGGIV
jgi:hypothetical protein